LAGKFTLSAFQVANDAVMGKATDRCNLQEAILVSGSIEATHETSLGRHRPACLYSTRAG
jgi:hypothetical protein